LKKDLRMACFKFHLACFNKLEKKEQEGFKGWNMPENKKELEQGLLEHIVKGFSPDNLVDISNYCNMLWNLDHGAKERALKKLREKGKNENKD